MISEAFSAGPSYEKDSLTARPLSHYKKIFAGTRPEQIADRLCIPFDEEKGTFSLFFLGSGCVISWPDFALLSDPGPGKADLPSASDKAKILLLRFLLRAPASKGSGAFKGYRSLPWGEVYFRQFNERCQKRLAHLYGNRLSDFSRSMRALGGRPAPGGDASFILPVFSGYELMLRLWEGDEEFPPSAIFLFSDNFPLAFEAEDIAQMGDLVIEAMKNTALGDLDS